MNKPIMYNDEMMMNYFQIQPNEVKAVNNPAVTHYVRYLYNLIYSRFKFTLPENWALNYFRFWLFHYGSVAVCYTKKLGWINGRYGVTSLDWQYQPKTIEMTNKYINGTVGGIIGKNCEIVKLFDDYTSFNDMVIRYAEKLAQIDKDIDINLMNTNVSMVFTADNKGASETIKSAYEKATSGTPLVVVDGSTLKNKKIETFFPNVKNNYIVNDLLDSKRTIINEFLTKIGIANANTDKKERLVTSEVESNNDETKALISVVYENIKTAFDKLNKFEGLNLAVELVEGGDLVE